MWSLDLSPATEEICYGGIEAAAPSADRGERGASRRRGRASPVMQPCAGTRRTRRDGRSFPERQSLSSSSSSSIHTVLHGSSVTATARARSRSLSSHQRKNQPVKTMGWWVFFVVVFLLFFGGKAVEEDSVRRKMCTMSGRATHQSSVPSFFLLAGLR